jgi:hypothetical protein
MQILIALIVMGVVGTAATILVATAAVIQLAPLLVASLVVVGVLRRWQRRRHRPRPAPRGDLRPALPWPSPPVSPCPDGWVLVAVWGRPECRVHRPPVVDADILSVEEHHG